MQLSHLLPRARSRHWGAGCLLAFTAAGTCAQVNFEEDFDNREKAWKEIAVQLPAPPLDENLLTFDVGPTATHVFAVDAKSLSVGSDGVVRYTLVTKSQSGAKNVSYEGIRCQSKERRLYAFGHADGSWGRSRRNEWEPLSGARVNPPQSTLAIDYFCQGGTIAGTAAEIVNRIRSQQRLWGKNFSNY